MDAKARDEARARLRRVAGQIGGIQRMLDDHRSCVDVLLQITAAEAALTETAKVVLAGHVASGLGDALRAGDEGEQRQKIHELVDVFARFCRIGAVPAGSADPERGGR